MASLQLEVVTPDRKVVCSAAEYVGIPGVEGEFGVLPGHIPYLSALAIGSLHYDNGGKTKQVFISGGFAEISNNKVSILAESAENAEDIDIERAQKAKTRALARLEQTSQSADVDLLRAQASLHRAIIRLTLRS